MVLEKDGKDQLDRSYEECGSTTESWRKGKSYIQKNKKEANLFGHILCRDCLLKHVIGGEIEGGREVTRRRERRAKQLLDDIKEMRGYCKLKKEALDRPLWRTGFGKGCGPVVRQIKN